MNQIYLNAFATIVALASENADTGLTGVRPYPQHRVSHIETVEGIRLTTIRPSLAEEYSKLECTWTSRAWTFQEHLLSRRSIFFGSGQAYFSCLSATFTEDRMEGQDDPYRLYNHPGYLLLDPPTQRGQWQWKVWKRYVELYSARHSTLETDRFLAFQGILNEQQNTQTWNLTFIAGLPLEYLPLSLLWWHGSAYKEQSATEARRIDDFPSWTWIGWSGEITYDESPRYTSVLDKIEVCCEEQGNLSYRYNHSGTLLRDEIQPRNPSQTSAMRLPQSQPSDGSQDTHRVRTMSSKAMLAFKSYVASVTTFADDDHVGFNSIKDERGNRVGKLSSINTLNIAPFHVQCRCTCVILGTSCKPIGFLKNIEFFLALTPEEKSQPRVLDDVLAPPGARYEQRYNQSRRLQDHRLVLSPQAPVVEFARHPWLARLWYCVMISVVTVLCALFAVTLLAVSFLSLGLVLAALVLTGLLYGFYLGLIRSLWASSDYFRLAHLIWIEEVRPGVYERKGIGVMRYSAWKGLRPEERKIQLI
jgi:hypothetical protein